MTNPGGGSSPWSPETLPDGLLCELFPLLVVVSSITGSAAGNSFVIIEAVTAEPQELQVAVSGPYPYVPCLCEAVG